jgi:hypothetical protein
MYPSYQSSKRIGELLIDEGFIDHGQLREALLIQQNCEKKLGEILVANKAVTAFQLGFTLCKQRVARMLALLILLASPTCFAEQRPNLMFAVESDTREELFLEDLGRLSKYFNSIQYVPQGLGKAYEMLKRAANVQMLVPDQSTEKGFRYHIEVVDTELDPALALQVRYHF